MKARSGELLFRLAGIAAIAILVNAGAAKATEDPPPPDCLTDPSNGCTVCIVDNDPDCIFGWCPDGRTLYHCFF